MKIKFPAGIKSVLIASLIISSLAVSCENPWMIMLIDKYFNDRTEDVLQPENSSNDDFNDPNTEGDYRPEDSPTDGFDDPATEGDYKPEDSPNADSSSPTAADFNVSGTGTVIYDGYVKNVHITAKQGKSGGAITVWYEGTGGTVYLKSTAAPSAVGKYTITFDVGAAAGWNAAYGLSADALNIVNAIADSVNDFALWMSNQPANTADTPYTIALNGINNYDISSIRATLNNEEDKYVYLDLSGSTFNNIPNYAFNTGSPSYTGCTTLTGITMPANVTSIGEGAFYNCSGLTGSLTIPDGVTSIGNYAFFYCSGFTGALTISDSVKSIGNSAFSGCSGLTGFLTIPDEVTSIGDQAFRDCSGLTGPLTIPNGVTGIGDSAFLNCSGLTGNLTIPKGVTGIAERAFSGCSGLTGVTIHEDVISIGDQAFSGCSSLADVTIENGVTIIGSHAFESCRLISNITIPNSITGIGDYAFYGCSGLISVAFEGTILFSGFGATNSFPGDLREKFYATDATNGTPGTYTRESGGTVWTKSD